MQKTNFRFEAIVHDDASTDNTASIIREYEEKYPDIIKPIYEVENQYSKGGGVIEDIMVSHMRGKYIAICEGDDYWTDPLKLQKQVDFLEQHPDFSVTSHRFTIFDQDKKTFESDGNEKTFKNQKGIIFDHHSKGYIAKTLTLVYRSDALTEYHKYPGAKWDIVLVYFLLKTGKGFCFSDIMGTYRRNECSSYGHKSYLEQKKIKFLQYKELYQYERNPFTRKRYYNSLIRWLYFSHGKGIHDIEFSLDDLFFVPYYLIGGLFRVCTGVTSYKG